MIDNLALGAMFFGTLQDERTSFDLLDRFVDAGGTWIDTANCYAFWKDPSGFGGQSEELLGRWLARRPGLRDRVRISTKVGAEPTVAGQFPEGREGLSARVVKSGIETSLRRLGTDHVDLFWAHLPDESTPLTETVGAFAEVATSGAALRLGCSNYPTWQLDRARHIAVDLGGPGFTAVQQHRTYLSPRPGTRPTSALRFGTASDEVLHYLEHHPDMALWAYTPILSGSYTRPDRPLAPEYTHPGTTARLAALDAIATETATNRTRVVLAWLINSPHPTTPIVGVSTPTQLTDAIAGANLTLTPDQLARLDAAV